MTLDQLQAIKITIEKGSVAAAAKEMKRAPSAISMAIKNLESFWDLQIFDRSEYRLKLTPEGEVILPSILNVLDNANDLNKHASLLSRGEESKLKVSVNSIFPIHFIDSLLLKIQKKFPKTQMEINVDQMQEPINRLVKNDVDFAIAPFSPKHTNLMSKKILDIELVGVASKDYIESSKIKRMDLKTKNQIIVGLGSKGDDDDSAGILGSNTSWTVADFTSKLNLIKKGLGFGNLPLYMIENDLKSGRLIEIDCMQRISVPVYIYAPESEVIGECRNYFLNEIAD